MSSVLEEKINVIQQSGRGYWKGQAPTVFAGDDGAWHQVTKNSANLSKFTESRKIWTCEVGAFYQMWRSVTSLAISGFVVVVVSFCFVFALFFAFAFRISQTQTGFQNLSTGQITPRSWGFHSLSSFKQWILLYISFQATLITKTRH